MITKMETKDYVKSLRKRFRLTQQQLADKMHVNRRTLQYWEAGKNMLSSKFELLKRIEKDLEEDYITYV